MRRLSIALLARICSQKLNFPRTSAIHALRYDPRYLLFDRMFLTGGETGRTLPPFEGGREGSLRRIELCRCSLQHATEGFTRSCGRFLNNTESCGNSLRMKLQTRRWKLQQSRSPPRPRRQAVTSWHQHRGPGR